jgi:competence protein ComEA
MARANDLVERQRWVAGSALGLALVAIAVANVPPAAPPLAVTTGPVDLNTADAAELQLLPGIGPAIAERIVSDRDSRGPYRDADDLTRISGVGERTVLRLREFATVGD